MSPPPLLLPLPSHAHTGAAMVSPVHTRRLHYKRATTRTHTEAGAHTSRDATRETTADSSPNRSASPAPTLYSAVRAAASLNSALHATAVPATLPTASPPAHMHAGGTRNQYTEGEGPQRQRHSAAEEGKGGAGRTISAVKHSHGDAGGVRCTTPAVHCAHNNKDQQGAQGVRARRSQRTPYSKGAKGLRNAARGMKCKQQLLANAPCPQLA